MSDPSHVNSLVPKEWEDVPLSSLAHVSSGVTLGRNLDSQFAVEMPYLRVANVQDGYLDLSEMKTVKVLKSEVDRYLLCPGDVVMTEGGDFDKLGRGTIWDGQIAPCLHQNHIFRVRPAGSRLDSSYLAALTAAEHGRRYFLMCSKQTTNLASINTTQVRAFPVPLPPLPEQRKIASILTTVDSLIEQTEALIEKYRRVKQGMMADLLSRGVDAHGKLRPTQQQAPELYKQSELGWIPKEWDVSTLSKVSIGGPKNGYFKKPELVGSGYKLVNVTDLYQPYEIDTDHSAVQRVQATDSDYGKYRVEDGDLFLTRSSLVLGGIAHCNIVRRVKEPTVFECHVMRIRPNKNLVVPDFVAFYSTTPPARSYFMARAKQVTMTTIDQAAIGGLPVPVPSLDEQQVVASSILAIQLKIHSESKSVARLKCLKTGLMQDLLTGKVRVKVDEAEEVAANV